MITILEMLSRVANDMKRVLKVDLLWRLRKANVQKETDHKVTRISEYGVWGVRRTFEYGPNEAFFEADTIVLATGYKPENRLAEAFSMRRSCERGFGFGPVNIFLGTIKVSNPLFSYTHTIFLVGG